ncbi:hypothetical protein BDW75DRAFT_12560 [Aspergillus navahoensis]
MLSRDPIRIVWLSHNEDMASLLKNKKLRLHTPTRTQTKQDRIRGGGGRQSSPEDQRSLPSTSDSNKTVPVGPWKQEKEKMADKLFNMRDNTRWLDVNIIDLACERRCWN